MFQPVHSLFRKMAQRYGGKVAVSSAEGALSYAGLDTRSNLLAAALTACEAREEVVAFIGKPGTALVTALLGILKAGAVYMPVDISLPLQRIRAMIEETGCTTVIAGEDLLDELAGWQKEYSWSTMKAVVLNRERIYTVRLEEGRISPFTYPKPEGVEERETKEETGCYIFYTSGSTGAGKPILGNHKGLQHFIDWERTEFGVDENCRVSQLSRMTFDASLRDILLPLTSGGTVCIPGDDVRSNSRLLLEWLEQQSITLVHTVPSLFRLLSREITESSWLRLPQLRHLLMAGEPLYGKDITSWREYNGHTELVNLYGTSETTMAKTFHRIGSVTTDAGGLIHGGQPIPGAFIIIANSQGELCRIGEVGEIYIRTSYRSSGYYKQEALTKNYFIQNPVSAEDAEPVHRTGDMGRYLPDRSIEVLGRTDDQVKINGIRLQLAEIEQAVISIPGIEQAILTVHRNRQQQNELIAYYTSPKALPVASLRAQLLERFSEQVVPGYWIHLAELPLSANGKVNKKELPLPNGLLVKEEEYEATAEGLEQELEAIWKEVLGLERIGSKVSFFEIGGNSLKAIQLISRIYKSYGVLIRINEIFKYSTVRELADRISRVGLRQHFNEMNPVEECEHYPLSDSQKRLWIISQLEKDQVAYNVAFSYLFEGPLNRDAMLRAFRELVRRHENFRTTFIMVDDEPRQKIHDAGTFPFDVDFIDFLHEPDCLEKATRWTDTQSKAVFHLNTAPLLNASIIRLEEEKHVFQFCIHHILFDGWSTDVLVREFTLLYNSFSTGGGDVLSSLRVQYKDYAVWLQKKMVRHSFANSRNYWLTQFSEGIPYTTLPADFAAPARPTVRGGIRDFLIGKELTAAIRAACDEHDVTLFMFLQAALNALMYRYTGQRRLLIGSPVAGRFHPDLEDQIGFYINLTPFHTRLEPETTFRQLLQSVKENALEIYDHQMYPFVQLLDDLNMRSELPSKEIFHVVLQLQNTQFAKTTTLSFNQLAVSNFQPHTDTSKFDTTFTFVEWDEDKVISLGLEYKYDLYKSSTIENMQQELFALFQMAIDDGDITMREIKKTFSRKAGPQFQGFPQLTGQGISTDY